MSPAFEEGPRIARRAIERFSIQDEASIGHRRDEVGVRLAERGQVTAYRARVHAGNSPRQRVHGIAVQVARHQGIDVEAHEQIQQAAALRFRQGQMIGRMGIVLVKAGDEPGQHQVIEPLRQIQRNVADDEGPLIRMGGEVALEKAELIAQFVVTIVKQHQMAAGYVQAPGDLAIDRREVLTALATVVVVARDRDERLLEPFPACIDHPPFVGRAVSLKVTQAYDQIRLRTVCRRHEGIEQRAIVMIIGRQDEADGTIERTLLPLKRQRQVLGRRPAAACDR